MNDYQEYFDANKQLWNQRTVVHKDSSFYNLVGFKNGETVLADRKLLNSNEFKVLSYTEKLLIKLARNLWNGDDEISIYDIIEQLDDRNFNIFMSVLRILKR